MIKKNKIKLFIDSFLHGYTLAIKYYTNKRYRTSYKKNTRNKSVYGSFKGNSRKIKRELVKRNGEVCSWCSGTFDFLDLTVDHIIPVSKGGSNCLKNLRLMCEECHKIKTEIDLNGNKKISNNVIISYGSKITN